MKRHLFLIISLFLVISLFTNCKANYPVTQQSGKDDIAYLVFVSSGNKSYPVTVTLDGSTTFSAKTVKSKDANYKGTSYTVNTGKRKIIVSRNGTNLYEKNIFLSPQETKIITLQ